MNGEDTTFRRSTLRKDPTTLLPPSMEFENRAEITVKVHIKRLEGIPRHTVPLPHKRRWYVALNGGGFEDIKTKSQSRGVDEMVTWDESFDVIISTKLQSSLKIWIYRAHGFSNDEKIAVAEELDLVKISQGKEFFVELQELPSGRKYPGRLVIRAEVQLPKIDLSLAKVDLKGGELLKQFVRIPSTTPSWQRFLASFQQTTELARQISELNTTAKVAVGVISFAFTVVVNQIERDQRVCDLQDMMTSLLVFFRDIESLKQSSFLRDVLDRLLCQVSECTYFILQYREIESFAQRTAIHLTSDTDGVINQFSTVFSTLKAELALGTSLQTAINTEYILNKVNDIDIFLHINCLNHLQDTGWSANKKCDLNTRDFTLTRIQRWIASDERGVFVLTGPSGSGKSKVLHTIAGALDKMNRLGAGVFLNKYTKGKKTARSLMRTIVYYLARSNPCLGRKIAAEIARHPSLDSADATRYGELLIEVSNGLALYGPLVIVVDGLHEIKTPQEQEMIQNVLCRVAMEAHSQLRLIVSSRTWAPSSGPISVFWDVDQLDSPSPEYPPALQAAFEDLSGRNLLGGYAFQELKPLIQRHSLGSEQWVSAACEFLAAEPTLGRHFLDELLSTSQYPATMKDASTGVPIAILRLLLSHKAVLASDLLYTASGSKLFIEVGSEQSSDSVDSFTSQESSLSPALLFNVGYLVKAESPSVDGFIEHDIRIPSCLPGILSSLADVNPPLLPKTEWPLNIYQFYLRKASSADNKGPIYARLALPASKPLLDGQKIKDELGKYGMLSDEVKNMSARSPPGGCEWIILHHDLFSSAKKEGYNSVTVTTPVLTQAILERLACIWVYWSRVAKDDTCLRLRDGRGESNFLNNFSFNDFTYHGDHAELVCDGKRKGDLIPGDQIQVTSTEDNGKLWAVIAFALRN